MYSFLHTNILNSKWPLARGSSFASPVSQFFGLVDWLSLTHGRMQVKCFQWELARQQPRCAHRIRTATSWPWETYCECEICECVSKWGKTEFLKLNNKQTLSLSSWKSNSYLAATNWQQLLLWRRSGAHNWRCTPDWREGERERESLSVIMEVEEGWGSLRLSHAEGVEQKSVSVESCCVAWVCLPSV